MSALRISRRGYETVLVPLDDGCTPRRSVNAIRGAIGEPVFGMFVVGSSQQYHAPDKRTGEHSPKVRR